VSKEFERCAICGCQLRHGGKYAGESIEGRSHASRHHYVAERFFGRSGNRKGTVRTTVFKACPWGQEKEHNVFCYDCHEVVLHNPVLLLEDVQRFADIVRQRGLSEDQKTDDFSKIGGRIEILHEAIARGLKSLHDEVMK
jgi:hypothetical protein